MAAILVQLRVFFEDVGWTTIDDCEDYVLMIKAFSPELSSYVGYTYIGNEAKLIVINLYSYEYMQYALAA
mgnify:CR=1 FL=1